MQPIVISELFKGFIVLNLLALPLTALLTFYITVMGANECRVHKRSVIHQSILNSKRCVIRCLYAIRLLWSTHKMKTYCIGAVLAVSAVTN